MLADSGTVTFLKGWDFTGNFTFVDLVAASTNALNGALLCRRPDHYKMYTIVGVLMMALLGGLGGGITRDVLLGDVPSALTNPAYITLALGFGALGYFLAYAQGQLFREGLFQFMTSFSLPWYAIVGAQKAIGQGIPVAGAILLAVVGPTAGRWFIDVSSGVTPKHFIRGEWFVPIAAMTGLVWILVYWAGGNTWIAAGVAFVVGYTLRVLALWYAWEEPLASEPAGVYQHSDGRPMLGRKLKGKSQRELRDLGLLVENEDEPEIDGGRLRHDRRSPDRIGRSLSMPIEQIEGLPDAVVGLEAVGEVTSDDYERVANPAIERARAAHEKIRLVHVLDERLEGHTAGALWEDAKLGVTNLRSLERIAVVTDLEQIRTLVKGAAWSLPGEMRLFSNAERAEAIDWACEGLERET